MAFRSVNNLQFCKDDMRRAYREKVGSSRRRRIKIRDIIDILDIVVPIIPHFFGSNTLSAGPDNYNSYGNNHMNGGYGRRDDDMHSFHCGGGGGGRFGLDMGSGDYGNESIHCGGRGNGNNHNGQYGMRMARADDYYDREITEEEFERLLEFAEQCNNNNNSRMY